MHLRLIPFIVAVADAALRESTSGITATPIPSVQKRNGFMDPNFLSGYEAGYSDGQKGLYDAGKAYRAYVNFVWTIIGFGKSFSRFTLL